LSNEGCIIVDGKIAAGVNNSLFVPEGESVLMEVDVDTLSVRWKSLKERKWRAYELSE